MELKEGDLVVTLPKVEKMRAIIDKIGQGKIGVVVNMSSRFDKRTVYGVLLEGTVYYLFEDEFEKLEEK
jgi:hypothetical protein